MKMPVVNQYTDIQAKVLFISFFQTAERYAQLKDADYSFQSQFVWSAVWRGYHSYSLQLLLS